MSPLARFLVAFLVGGTVWVWQYVDNRRAHSATFGVAPSVMASILGVPLFLCVLLLLDLVAGQR